MHTMLLTVMAMIAFAANSVLCRLALGEASIDAASFTLIRLFSGAMTLLLILLWRKQAFRQRQINYASAVMLFIYAIFFAFAYINIATGTGAIILFGTVQLTMIGYGIYRGARPGRIALLGVLAAFAGLIYLLLPGISAPPLASALLMVVAGIAWGVYSLRGKGSQNPLYDTAWNFIATVPLAVITSLVFIHNLHITTEGVMWAIASGALASGLGYAIWYAALPRLSPTHAASVQLSVPVIAAIGGVVLMAEPVTLRMIIAGSVVLGGIYLTIRFSGRS